MKQQRRRARRKVTPVVGNSNPVFRLRRGLTLSNEKAVWMDMHGASYCAAFYNEAGRQKFRQYLVNAIAWLDTTGAKYISNNSLTVSPDAKREANTSGGVGST